jgi:hypothetical protein
VGWQDREAILVSWRRGGMEGPFELVKDVGASWKMWAGRRSEGCGRHVSTRLPGYSVPMER